MKALLRSGFLLAILSTTLNAHAQQPLEQMVAAERAFAQAALQTTTRQAFLASMADSAIMFNNGQPELGKPGWQKRPEQPNAPKLRWAPAFASMAGSGELGYTTGPWYIEQPNGQRMAHGQFFTIWGRQPDGSFRFLVDVGVSHPAPATVELPTQVVTASTAPAKARPKSLPPLDEQLSAAVQQLGAGKGYAGLLSAQARLLRETHPPLTTPSAIAPVLATDPARRFTVRGQGLSGAGDFAYTYGTYLAPQTPADQGGYLHVWQQEARGWRLVAEVLTPAAPKPKP
ncbi:nuclear transport factor 2 family protein [Hymenobacter lucidus]|uniref:Nuclear transport factor 2 family protein n=1 Tax=Hymenobacter lucidus TaxID=2880930 RepID=A0ABS8AT54_9BACT|nr:nuclear transport factor 2 family protein [Hymenobacter lucidus]MCB2407901.1 nuclear transport factor 2 family protein [Hymenobacter lucidus]